MELVDTALTIASSSDCIILFSVYTLFITIESTQYIYELPLYVDGL